MNQLIHESQTRNISHKDPEAERTKLRAELLRMILRKEAERKTHSVPQKSHSENYPTMQPPHVSIRT